MSEVAELSASPMTAQIFGNAGREHMKKFGMTFFQYLYLNGNIVLKYGFSLSKVVVKCNSQTAYFLHHFDLATLLYQNEAKFKQCFLRRIKSRPRNKSILLPFCTFSSSTESNDWWTFLLLI